MRLGNREASMEGLSRSSINKQWIVAREAASKRYFEPVKRREPSIARRPQDNLVGVGIARKIRDGRRTSELCVCFYVERKVPREELAAPDILPDQIEGLPTDVIETGRFHALAGPLIERLRPAKPGCSISRGLSGEADDPTSGTFGALVEAGGKLFILSNNHVLANRNALSEGMPILQPGSSDSGSAETDQIARLSRIEPLKVETERHRRLRNCRGPQGGTCKSDPHACRKAGSGEPLKGRTEMAVEKTGRKTRFTSGMITDVKAEVMIDYADLGEISFKDQIFIVGHDGAAFSGPGDSGSLIVKSQSKRPVGLICAGSGRRSVANHIEDVLAALNVKIVA